MELKIDHNSQLPLHAQVEALLRKLIELPEYKNGNLMPKEVDLSKRLGISRNTLRQATNKLVNEGLLIRKKGVGTVAAKRNVLTQLESWHSFTQEMNEQGVAFKNYDIQAQKVSINKEVSRFFRIEEYAQVLELRRLRGDEEGPFVYFISYFHPRIGLTGKEDFSQPLYELLEKEYSTIPVRSSEVIRAKLPEIEIAKKLNINPESPILIRERSVYDPGDRPIEYNIGYYRADKFSYSVDIKR
jgi:GntR family transcriptional regulator